jgi:GDSL-like lipase/acylhydrolase family protein
VAAKDVLLGIGALVGALALAEVGLAIVDYPAAYTDHQQLFVEYDSVRGWRNIPNAHRRYVTPEFAVAMDYNAHAYRGPLIPYEKPAGTRRVLLLGDSYLEAYSVPLEDRIAEVAQRELPGTQIIALGTGGYSTDQELLWLESEGLRYSPDLVVVLFCINDVWYNNRASYPRGAKPVFQIAGDSLRLTGVPVPRVLAAAPTHFSLKHWIGEHSHLLRLVRRAMRHSATLQQVTGVADEVRPFQDPRSPAGDSAMVLTERLLARMKAETSQRLVVMLIPAPRLPSAPGRFAEICRAARVECVDPTERFAAAAARESLAFPEDDHWNAAGHKLAAAVLTEIVHAHF